MKRVLLLIACASVFLTGCIAGYTDEEISDLENKAWDRGYETAMGEMESKVDEAYDKGYEDGYADGSAPDNTVTWAAVYYTDSGECYHMNPSCTSIRYNDNVHETTLDKIKDSGLRPCDICVPHSDD